MCMSFFEHFFHNTLVGLHHYPVKRSNREIINFNFPGQTSYTAAVSYSYFCVVFGIAASYQSFTSRTCVTFLDSFHQEVT